MIKRKKYARAFVQPKGSFFLFGPRGTGKTTLIEGLGLGQHEISLLDEERYQDYLAQPGLFFEELVHLKDGSWVFIDEIQRLPGLLNEVHRLIEKKKIQIRHVGIKREKTEESGR
jgi:uncharacterized protein